MTVNKIFTKKRGIKLFKGGGYPFFLSARGELIDDKKYALLSIILEIVVNIAVSLFIGD